MKRWQIIALLALGIIGVTFLNKRVRTSAITFSSEAIEAIVNKASELVAKFEGLRLSPYQDTAGLWTIGYGHLIIESDPYYHPKFNPNGMKTITKEQADNQLEQDMLAATNAVDRVVKVPINENQKSALMSLVFNIGETNFAYSTLLRKLNAGDYDGAALEFARWNKIRNPVGDLIPDRGLTSRRSQEKDIFTSA